jgi:glucan 1,3-beta-glucosidase
MESAQDPFANANAEPAPDVPSDSNLAVNVPELPTAVNDLEPPSAVNDLEPPRASYLASETSTPRDSSYVPTPSNSSPLLPVSEKAKAEDYADADVAGGPRSKRPRYLLFVIPVILVILILVVILPVYFAVIKPHQHHAAVTNSGASGPSQTVPANPGSTGRPKSTGAISGGDGSTITTANGSTFIYNNTFGGFCKSFGVHCYRISGFRISRV